MYKKSRKMILAMLGIALFMVCGLTVAHVFTGSQPIDPSQTPNGGWSGTLYGSYDGYTHQLTITPQVDYGTYTFSPGDFRQCYFKVFKDGTALPFPNTGNLNSLGSFLYIDGSLAPLSTNLDSFGSVPDGNITISVTFGGTAYNSRFNYLGYATYLNITGNNKPDMNTSILGENKTVNSGDSLNYKVRLVDSDGNPVTGASVTFNCNGEDHTVTTDGEGYTSYEFTNIMEDMTVTATYNGAEGANAYYLSSTGSFMISVNPAPNPDNGGTDGNGGNNGFDGLPWTGIPILVLVLAIVGGIYYYKKKYSLKI